MAEDWRVTATMRNAGDAHTGLLALHEHEADRQARAELGDRVAVSRDDDTIFLYADAQRAAQSAELVLRGILAKHEIDADFTLDRWHHEEERWEAADIPLPHTAAEHRIEHERLEADETADSQRTGAASWEIRIDVGSHHAAVELERRLRAEGRTVVRRWKYLLVGANDEDDARGMARELASEVPAGTAVHVEPGSELAWEWHDRRPFAVFGGLGV